MGRDGDPMAVTITPQLRVRGIDGLHVVDAEGHAHHHQRQHQFAHADVGRKGRRMDPAGARRHPGTDPSRGRTAHAVTPPEERPQTRTASADHHPHSAAPRATARCAVHLLRSYVQQRAALRVEGWSMDGVVRRAAHSANSGTLSSWARWRAKRTISSAYSALTRHPFGVCHAPRLAAQQNMQMGSNGELVGFKHVKTFIRPGVRGAGRCRTRSARSAHPRAGPSQN